MPNNHKFLTFRSFDAMPPNVYASVRMMGSVDEGYHLRNLAKNSHAYIGDDTQFRLRSAIVMTVGDVIVGWAALYNTRYQLLRSRINSNVGVWVKHRYRGNGYGMALIVEAHRRWKGKEPNVYEMVESVWDDIERNG